MVPTCKARTEKRPRFPGPPWAQFHPRAHEQAGQREEGCVSKSSKLLFHLLTLLVLWVPRQLYLPVLLEASSTQVGPHLLPFE